MITPVPYEEVLFSAKVTDKKPWFPFIQVNSDICAKHLCSDPPALQFSYEHVLFTGALINDMCGDPIL